MVSTMIAVAKFAGYAAVGVTGAISAGAMAIPCVILGQEAVKSCTHKTTKSKNYSRLNWKDVSST